MFTKRLLKYITQNQLLYNPRLLQDIRKSNFLCNSHYISSANLVQKFDSSELTSKLRHDENTQSKLTETDDLSEKEFLVRLKNDPDKFGSSQEEEIVDEGDIREEKYFTEQPSPSQKLRTKQYADIIKKLIRDRKIKEAVDVVEVRMLKQDRVKPENYIFNLLLGACGRVGYTKKAFMLYNEIKRRGLTVTGGTYTALFNACANSPWPTTDGLTRAHHLYNIMIEKGYQPNDTNYNAMIKAFGRCGDLPTAFNLVDEMYSKGFQVKDDSINFLLQACITDKDAGFRHALLVWRKLVSKKIKPSIYTYNLMLRCIRDCGLGNIEVTQDVITKIVSNSNGSNKLKENGNTLQKNSNHILLSSVSSIINLNEEHEDRPNLLTEENQQLQLHDSSVGYKQVSEVNIANAADESQLTTIVNDEQNLEPKDLRPDLMAEVPHLGSLISLSEITKPEERLLLVGGCSGFLNNMSYHSCTPNIKTFTQLLDCIPNTVAAEKELLTAIRKHNVKPDIDFYNILIKKRSMRFDYESAKEVLILMQQLKYRPNLVTYGVLALGCKTKEEGLELVTEMKDRKYRLNAEILGTMLHQACHYVNFGYVLEMMELCVKENVQPNKKFMETLVEFKKKCRDLLNDKKLSRSQQKAFGIFKARYKIWLGEVEVDETEDAHPWQQYRQPIEGSSKYEWKDAKSRFKPRHASLFKVKTSPKHKK